MAGGARTPSGRGGSVRFLLAGRSIGLSGPAKHLDMPLLTRSPRASSVRVCELLRSNHPTYGYRCTGAAWRLALHRANTPLRQPDNRPMPHAVSLLRAARLARATKPFLARGGFKRERCTGCRLLPSHCMCAQRPVVPTRAGICLLMADIEPLKPSNTGWLIADMVSDTFAFGWARTETDPALLRLLRDPQWQPYVVFPGEYATPERVVTTLGRPAPPGAAASRLPLFILLDGTWAEARKMFSRSPYLDALPVLSLQPQGKSEYKLRRSRRDDHFCTSEVAALCLALAGEEVAGQTLAAYLDVFTHHYLQARNQLPVAWDGPAHRRLRAISRPAWVDGDRPRVAAAPWPLRSAVPVPRSRRS